MRQSLRASEVISRWLCDHAVQVVHGTIALALGNEHTLLFRRACGSTEHPLLLGTAGDRHVVGLPISWLRLAGKEPAISVDGIGLAWAVAPVHPDRGISTSDRFSYFDDAPDKLDQPTEIVLRFTARGDSAVALTSLKPGTGETRVSSVTRDGTALEPRARTSLGAMWLGIGNPKHESEWTITLRTDVPRWVDVVTF